MKSLGLLLIVSSLFLGSIPPSSAPSSPRSVAEQYLFQAANAERVQRGLSALRWDDALYRAATDHAIEMARRRSIFHQYPGEAVLSQRGQVAGAHFSLIAENVAEASNAVRIHDAWMNSAGHRENLLDSRVDAVGISVIARDGQLYAVQDFQRSVPDLNYAEQERTIAALVAAAGPVEIVPDSTDARRTCALETGYAGERQPFYVMRFTTGELNRLPDTLLSKVASGRFHEAAIGACAAGKQQAFTTYNIVVLLYP